MIELKHAEVVLSQNGNFNWRETAVYVQRLEPKLNVPRKWSQTGT